jgi:hypothetical protein
MVVKHWDQSRNLNNQASVQSRSQRFARDGSFVVLFLQPRWQDAQARASRSTLTL